MNRLWHLLKTSVGKKLLVALTGSLLLLFVIGHLLGNLTIFFGASALNAYAHFLQSSPFIWLVRIGLLAILCLHILLAAKLVRSNLAARNGGYKVASSYLSKLFEQRLFISGLVIMLFIIAHVSHLTLGIGSGEVFSLRDESGYLDVYSRVVAGFLNPLIAWGYMLVMLFVGIHVKHTSRAIFQSLGFYHESYAVFLEWFSWILAVIVVSGFISIPLLVQLGLMPIPDALLSLHAGA